MATKQLVTAIVAVIALSAAASSDSVKVVKGQVSDYYIPVVQQYTVTGVVTDQEGHPLEGATVMWLYSPAHSNTDSLGRYSLIATDTDRDLCVHYPGMEQAIVRRKAADHQGYDQEHGGACRNRAICGNGEHS